eukprot:GHVT01100296.1.p1 GENE.GHVT01100296.1~~GHVT01100296.1.p1  ORF type:complete len:427 (+),score=88.72 GHVT01100296.1:250-1530(+)
MDWVFGPTPPAAPSNWINVAAWLRYSFKYLEYYADVNGHDRGTVFAVIAILFCVLMAAVTGVFALCIEYHYPDEDEKPEDADEPAVEVASKKRKAEISNGRTISPSREAASVASGGEATCEVRRRHPHKSEAAAAGHGDGSLVAPPPQVPPTVQREAVVPVVSVASAALVASAYVDAGRMANRLPPFSPTAGLSPSAPTAPAPTAPRLSNRAATTDTPQKRSKSSTGNRPRGSAKKTPAQIPLDATVGRAADTTMTHPTSPDRAYEHAATPKQKSCTNSVGAAPTAIPNYYGMGSPRGCVVSDYPTSRLRVVTSPIAGSSNKMSPLPPPLSVNRAPYVIHSPLSSPAHSSGPTPVRPAYLAHWAVQEQPDFSNHGAADSDRKWWQKVFGKWAVNQQQPTAPEEQVHAARAAAELSRRVNLEYVPHS